MIKNSENQSKISFIEYIYMIIVTISIFLRSMFKLGETIIYFNYGLIIFLVIFILLNFKINIKVLMWFILGCICSIGTHSLQPFLIVSILFIANFINITKIMNKLVYIIFFSLLIIYLATIMGIIPNLISSRNGISRMALGMQFPLVFSTYVFYGCIYLTLIFYKKTPTKLTIMLIFIVFLLDRLTNSRNDELCIILLIILIWLVRTKYLNKKIVFYSVYFITFIVVILSIFITKFLPYTSSQYMFIDRLLSGRLSLQYILWSFYSPHLFGQYIPQQGLGGVQQLVENYFYIDNSYARIMFMYGILFFIFLILTFALQILKYKEQNKLLIGFILLDILISGISADSLSLLTQSVIILPLFFINSNISNNDGSETFI